MAKGIKTGGGSRKGSPNKITKQLRDAIDEAFQAVGGSTYLVNVAKDNPAVFCALLGKTLPKDVNVGGQSENPVSVKLENSKSWLSEILANAANKS